MILRMNEEGKMDMQNDSAHGKRKRRLTCLISFVIVIIILGVIAGIAIPNFLTFCAKAKQSEAKSNLGMIYTAQMAYFSETGTYAGHTETMNCFQLIGWEPSGQNRYKYLCDTADIQSKPQPTMCEPYQTIMTTKEGFTAIAVANIDSDPFCDFWAINDDKVLQNRYVNHFEWGDKSSDSIWRTQEANGLNKTYRP